MAKNITMPRVRKKISESLIRTLKDRRIRFRSLKIQEFGIYSKKSEVSIVFFVEIHELVLPQMPGVIGSLILIRIDSSSKRGSRVTVDVAEYKFDRSVRINLKMFPRIDRELTARLKSVLTKWIHELASYLFRGGWL